jgi:sporulation protein YlmC with PRC-barrel domain
MRKLLTGSAVAIALLGTMAARANAVDVVVTNAGPQHHCRVSKIESLQVRNTNGDDLGKIKDLVIDVRPGKIAYAALDFGDFLGVGDKMFAVPWSAFTVKEDGKDHYLVLDVTKERLKNAPGFDKDHWPDMANPNWAAPVDQFYNAPRTTSSVR